MRAVAHVVSLVLALPGLPAAASASDPAGVGGATGWPLRPPPAVVTPFDPPDSPWGAGHRGVDLLGSAGQQVLAAAPGTVRFAGMLAGRPLVVVDHGTVRTTYEPVRPAADIRVGVTVAVGAVLGTLEVRGSHCPPRACLHWGLIRDADDAYLDPLSLVGGGPVRLLPWDAVPAPTPTIGPWTPLIAALGLPPAVAFVAPALAAR